MIGICTPSRGLIFSKTVQSIIEGMQFLNKNGLATKFYTTHDMPIPNGHSYCVAQALQDDCKVIVFIEEDMYVFPEGYMALVSSESPITTMQYNDKNGSPNGIIHRNEKGEIIWGGLGATAIKADVFRDLGEPYFRTDTRYRNIKKKEINGVVVTEYEPIEKHKVWDKTQNKFVEVDEPYQYGGLDIDFYTRARHKGYKIELLPNHKAHHFDLVALGDRHINNGLHTIKQV